MRADILIGNCIRKQRIEEQPFAVPSNYCFFKEQTLAIMADLAVDLIAPNGTKVNLPTGLFINNEFVKSSSGAKITSINPRYELPRSQVQAKTDPAVMNLKSPL